MNTDPLTPEQIRENLTDEYYALYKATFELPEIITFTGKKQIENTLESLARANMALRVMKKALGKIEKLRNHPRYDCDCSRIAEHTFDELEQYLLSGVGAKESKELK